MLTKNECIVHEITRPRAILCDAAMTTFNCNDGSPASPLQCRPVACVEQHDAAYMLSASRQRLLAEAAALLTPAGCEGAALENRVHPEACGAHRQALAQQRRQDLPVGELVVQDDLTGHDLVLHRLRHM